MSEDPRERSGSFQLPPNTQPTVHAPTSITLDARTILMAIVFLLGGGAAGSGVSLMGGSSLEAKVDQLTLEVRTMASTKEDTREKLSDHEKRIRDLERKP